MGLLVYVMASTYRVGGNRVDGRRNGDGNGDGMLMLIKGVLMPTFDQS